MRCRQDFLCLLLAVLVLLLSSACQPGEPIIDVSPRPDPTLIRTPLPADTGWLDAGAGVETRELAIEHRSRRERLFIARVDPVVAAFQVRYAPGGQRRVREWLEAEGARLVVNAGFFDKDFRAQGLLISDGRASGQSYSGFGGLFGVSGGRVQVRSLILQPYKPDEPFEQMIQSFPMLLIGNGAVNPEIPTGDEPAPRTVAGLDHSGRVVFLVSPRPTFALLDLATWLAQSDLDLDVALNLDGGTSSGLVVRMANKLWGIDSWVAVPAVILVP